MVVLREGLFFFVKNVGLIAYIDTIQMIHRVYFKDQAFRNSVHLEPGKHKQREVNIVFTVHPLLLYKVTQNLC